MDTQKRILTIDDEEGVRNAFLLALEDSGHTVDTAATGEEGLEKVAANPPDLIFLDLRMPGIGGVETLYRLQKDWPQVPIYIVTAFHEQYFKELEQAVTDGLSFELIRKPAGMDVIRDVVTGTLGTNAAEETQ